jgi:hypothetical protein
MLQSLPQRHPKAPAAPATSRAATPAPQTIHSSFRLSFSPTGIPSVNLAQSPELFIQTQQKTEETARGIGESEHKAASAEDCTAADEGASVSAGVTFAWSETRPVMGADNEPEAYSAEDQLTKAQLASEPIDDSWAASKPHDTASQAFAHAVASDRPDVRARASAAAVSKARVASSCDADAVSELAGHSQPALVNTVNCSSSSRIAGSSMETVGAAMHGSTVASEHTLSQPGQEQGVQPLAGLLGPAVTHPGGGEAGSMHAAASASASATTNRPEAALLRAHQSKRYEASPPVSQAQTLAAQLSDNTRGLSAAGQAADLSSSHSSSSLLHSSQSLRPPSSPMLAWLNALASPGSAAVPEQTPLLSMPASPLPPQVPPMPLPDQATLKLSHQTAPAASPAHARIQASNLTPHPLLQINQITSPMGVTLLHPQAVETCSARTSTGVVSNQATPDDPVPGQTGVLSAVSSSRAAAGQATPDAWPRQATPALGLSTGLSGLTTPPSAAEMHRYAAVLPHKLKHFLKLCVCVCVSCCSGICFRSVQVLLIPNPAERPSSICIGLLHTLG